MKKRGVSLYRDNNKIVSGNDEQNITEKMAEIFLT